MHLGKMRLGGKTFASGGFGCVFRPSLKCKKTRKREPRKISKLMTTKHALEEYNEVLILKQLIHKIDNYSNYFIIDGFTICEPSKLTLSDLKDFNKCSALPKDNIVSTNINQSLDKLLLINIPDGGEALDNYINKNNTYEEIIKINNSLIDLLLNGIIPMNKLNIYHTDVKDSNILISYSNNKLNTRLIDWGLSVIYHPHKNETLSKNWKNRPLQYNVPFSIILFSDNFENSYSTFLKNNTKKITKNILMSFVINYINEWNAYRGQGHFKMINYIMTMFFNKKHPRERENVKFFIDNYTMPFISNYIVDILFTFKGSVNLRDYLDNVFVKNVDVWGLLITYYPILEIIYDNYKTSSSNDIKIFNFIKKLFLTFLYKNGGKIINVQKLVKELNNLNNLFKYNFVKNKTKRKNKLSNVNNKSQYNSHRNLKNVDF